MVGLQYYFFPTDFYYPRPPKINGDTKISTNDAAATAVPPASGAAWDRRDMLLQDKILKVSTPLSMNLIRYQPVLVFKQNQEFH
ncbi:hypothetical protein A4A49_51135 [Nicotiana attenuata]|uniref:Uncharacterized protein n=1 Tax=Nicotiana attenuata TaxID=49451 RepID=A0A1J6JBB8_NICAT|nr:hypothetical protein A4A49_51135 [Nicotiana attenuata]